MSGPRTAAINLGSFVHQLTPTKTLPGDTAVVLNRLIAEVEQEAVADVLAKVEAAVRDAMPSYFLNDVSAERALDRVLAAIEELRTAEARR